VGHCQQQLHHQLATAFMASTIEEQVASFASGAETEYAFPAELNAHDRKLVKKIAEKFGLPSCSYGMGSERRIHIFRPAASTVQVLKPVEYSVKNTFVDSIMTSPSPSDPAHQSMPVGFQEHIAAEEAVPPKELGATLVEKLDVMLGKTNKMKDSPRHSQSGGSTADSESESPDPTISIKNTFVHFENDSEENADPRIIQSMPSGKFAESVDAEKQARTARQNRPVPFSDDAEDEAEKESALVFPATPNAEGHIRALDEMPAMESTPSPVPVVQWVSPNTAMFDQSITVLPPALWKPSPAQILIDSPIGAKQQQKPEPIAQQSSHMPSPLLPGTPVIVNGLASQPTYNGLVGLVIDFDSHHSRYNIAIEVGASAQRCMVKVKPGNLTIVQPVLPPQPSCYPPGQQQTLPPQPSCYPPGQQQTIPTRVAKAPLCLDQMV
jgi:hypothetical protein